MRITDIHDTAADHFDYLDEFDDEWEQAAEFAANESDQPESRPLRMTA